MSTEKASEPLTQFDVGRVKNICLNERKFTRLLSNDDEDSLTLIFFGCYRFFKARTVCAAHLIKMYLQNRLKRFRYFR